ncbi:MAG TPA: ABC transporter ATP-binding protein [Solirubrobacteraceae bacterium]|nr:ABC transporter ATP-binding protein [Solirubrobacteraceae bacterium]
MTAAINSIPAHPPPAAIVLEDLTRVFGERIALDEVSLTVEAGTTLVVFGPNGAGKSTLLRILATLLRPQLGTARVLGHELPREGWALRGKVGLLTHEPLLYRDLSVRENLRFHARLHGVAAGRIDEVLAATKLTDRAGDPIRALSRGLAQRAAVCRAILHDPPLLLLDEPRANLDPASVELVEPLIGRASGRTRVITSHDPRGGLAEADVALGLRGGRVELLRDAREVTVEDVGALYG